jgi:hypothetical protein
MSDDKIITYDVKELVQDIQYYLRLKTLYMCLSGERMNKIYLRFIIRTFQDALNNQTNDSKND